VAPTNILIVDDNPVNLKLVRVVVSGEGLALLRTFHPRLILMDIQLPDMDGLELTRRLKADPATAAIPIVAVTAYAMKGDEEKMLAAGCAAYVSKPIDTRTLGGLVSRLLGAA